jgi:cytochrome c-type biogenesis protein CcmF
MYYPGTILLWLAFLLGLASTVAYVTVIRGREEWRSQARQAYVLMTAAVVIVSGLLMYLLVTHDYRLAYVWSYSDNLLPLHYLISTFWGGQEGSFLLWIFFGALLGLPLMKFARSYESRVMVFYNLTLLSLIMLLLKQDPFRFHEGLTTAMIPMDGQGLNPLLQNPWMVIHPPVMFIGYASLAIPFAFALAALWMQRYDEWTKVSLPWVLLSLGTLGLAIMLGGYWAYETLGWGGYWGWDPVENASLVPWLMTAALTHGMLLQRARHRFRRLNLVLAVASYLLVVYATFLTRSGVLGDFSVHSFVDLGITGWLVFNMLFFLVLSIGLLAWRWRDIPTEVGEEPFLSRTTIGWDSGWRWPLPCSSAGRRSSDGATPTRMLATGSPSWPPSRLYCSRSEPCSGCAVGWRSRTSVRSCSTSSPTVGRRRKRCPTGSGGRPAACSLMSESAS